MKCLRKTLVLTAVLLAGGCGLYTTGNALNPPFSISKTQLTLQFSGYNPETYFSGYVLWYKEDAADDYFYCQYKDVLDIPTIPKYEDMLVDWVEAVDNRSDIVNPRIDYTVDVSDIEDPTSGKSFSDIYQDDEKKFYFAVSAWGVNGEESALVEFGLWPQ
jgi:hypothetical protein